MYPREILEHIHAYISNQGFYYPKRTIANLYLSLKSKPFVILAGISGTGKTQLVRHFAAALGHREHCYLIAVKPDWTDASFLLGYRDGKGDFQPGPMWEALVSARQKPGQPHFVLLDEMNLARVEYYLSDLLSLMETREKEGKHIYTEQLSQEGESWSLPDNLYLIGTINIDEASYTFSRKVLDRANVIEMNDIHLDWVLMEEEELEERPAIGNDFLKAPYVHLKDLPPSERDRQLPALKLLRDVNELLWQIDSPFGYRVRDEILFYMANRYEIRELISEQEALDFQILQKILPRIYGNSRSLRRVLYQLILLLSRRHDLPNEAMTYPELKDALGDLRKQHLPYPMSLEKLLMMYRRWEEDGFTTFWL